MRQGWRRHRRDRFPLKLPVIPPFRRVRALGYKALSARRELCDASRIASGSGRQNVHRTSAGVVANIGNELIVDRRPRRRGQRITVVGFENLLLAAVGQPSIGDENAKACGIEKRDVFRGDSVEKYPRMRMVTSERSRRNPRSKTRPSPHSVGSLAGSTSTTSVIVKIGGL